MLLEHRIAVIYGAAGATGSAVARAFAREGARVIVTGRGDAVEALARELIAAGGAAEAACVDALDERAVEEHLEALIARTGRVDVSFNAIGIPQQGIQGMPLTALPVESFMGPIAAYCRAHFVTARAAARRMMEQRSGVILLHTPEPARIGVPLVGGMGPAWAALEGFVRQLSSEVGPHGVRALGLRTTGMPETKTIDVVFDLHAQAAGLTRQQFQSTIEGLTHRRRSTTLREFADAAVFVASDRATAITGTILNLTGGIAAD